jgi:hypothetical protein
MVVDGWVTHWNRVDLTVTLREGRGCQCNPQCMCSRVIGQASTAQEAIKLGEWYMMRIFNGESERISGIG